jgi:hypothetical protein
MSNAEAVDTNAVVPHEVDLPIYQRRMARCRACHNSRRLLGQNSERIIQCTLCHCIMNIKNRLPNARCPINLF